MQPQILDSEQRPLPKAWALSYFAEILKVGPPQLNEIIKCLEGVGDIEKFIELVRMLLPEHEKEIMQVPRNKRVYQFCFWFGQKYYPLPANTDCSPSLWTQGIPVELLGFSYTAYHDMNMRPGFVMLLSLIIYPFEGDERDGEDDDVPYDPFDPMKSIKFINERDNYKVRKSDIKWTKDLVTSLAIDGVWIAPVGYKIVKTGENKIKITNIVDTPEARELVRRTIMVAAKAGIEVKAPRTGKTAKQKLIGPRMPLLDSVARIVGTEMASKIPAAGWTPEELHLMTDGTIYDGVGVFADWACSNTNTTMLDSNYEDAKYNEGDTEPIFKWTQRNVDFLTHDYPRVKEIREKMDHIVDWLEADQVGRFTGLLDHCLRNTEAHARKKVERYYDPHEKVIDLEQLDTAEEDEEDVAAER